MQYNCKIFQEAYMEALNEIQPFIKPEMAAELSVYNFGWKSLDLINYLKLSLYRCQISYTSFKNKVPKNASICDVCCLFPVFSLTLRKLGYNCTITEALQYYGPLFQEMFSYIEDQGVNVKDYDPFSCEETDFNKEFDVVLLMAVLEHYPHSPKRIIENLKRIMRNQRGFLYIEVPNLAYLEKRIDLLKGKTPLSQMNIVYNSEIPYTGHHREYTYNDLEEIAKLSNLKILESNFFNYSDIDSGIKHKIAFFYKYLIKFFFKDTREIISILLEKKTPI